MYFLYSCTEKKAKSDNFSEPTKIDSQFIGKTIKYTIEKLELDTNQFWVSDEPPGFLSGFNIKLNDTMLYYLNIDSSVTDISDSTMITYKQRYKHIIDRKIIFIEERNIKRKSKKYYK